MINLRKVTEAIIPDGAITKEKLADGAVDLSTAKVVGELPEEKLGDNVVTAGKIADNAVVESKIANSAVVESKLAALSISTEKLKDNVVTLAKSNDDVKVTPFVGGEVEQSIEGTTPGGIIETSFAKSEGKYEPKKVRIFASLKVDVGSGNEATLGVYIDEEVSPRISFNSVSNTYELVCEEADISDLICGRHKITLKLHTNNVGVKAYNDYVDILFVK